MENVEKIMGIKVVASWKSEDEMINIVTEGQELYYAGTELYGI